MPILQVDVPGGERRIPFAPGVSVRELLDTTDTRVTSACGGVGACGLCRVQVLEGSVADATPAERGRLSAEEIRQGVRLACQLRPDEDLRVAILNPAPISHWKSLPAWDKPFTPPADLPHHAPQFGRYGIAVDLGTTRIRITLWDLANRRRVAARTGLNPQERFGADVLTRLAAAAETEAEARRVGEAARNAVAEALRDIAARDLGGGKLEGALGRAVVVGNSAMLALISGSHVATLLQPESWERAISCRPQATDAWCRLWGGVEGCDLEVVQPLAGFVGSDLLAGVLATGLCDGPPGSLFIDLGTNTEIALWDGATLWVTSTAGGPAFEGSGISCGMPAEPGAIFRVECGGGTDFAFEVIGGGEPHGLCGSGLVDAVACLVATGQVNSGGRFRRPVGKVGFLLHQNGRPIGIRPADVDALQRAKAGVGAGTACLLSKAGVDPQALRRVCVAGEFGRFLNVPHAQQIGLLPAVAPERVELCGNSALAGCEQLLLCADSIAERQALVERAQLLNLSRVPEFEERFIANLRLQPMQADSP